MTNNDPGAPEYEYDWQNPNKTSFDVGRVVSNTFGVLKNNLVQFLLLTFVGAGIPMILISMWPIFFGFGEGINFYDPTWLEDIEWEGIVGSLGAFFLIYMIVSVIMYGAIIQMTMNALNDRSVRLGEAVKLSLIHI